MNPDEIREALEELSDRRLGTVYIGAPIGGKIHLDGHFTAEELAKIAELMGAG